MVRLCLLYTSSAKKEYASYELYPVRSGNLVEMEYAPGATRFTLWAPTADEVRLMLDVYKRQVVFDNVMFNGRQIKKADCRKYLFVNPYIENLQFK